MSSPSGPAGSPALLTITDVDNVAGEVERLDELDLRRAGVNLFYVVVAALGFVCLCLMFYVGFTYPQPADFAALFDDLPPAERVVAVQDATDRWRAHLIEIVQIGLVGPFIPLMTAILGYLFGTQKAG